MKKLTRALRTNLLALAFHVTACFALCISGAQSQEAIDEQDAAQVISQLSYPTVLSLLADTGITAELVTSDDNVSYLVGTYRNTSFIMRLIDCQSEKAEACTTLAIFANFVEDDGKTITDGDKTKINQYNENEVFGRAYYSADGTALGVDMVVSIEGGTTDAFVKAQLVNWTEALGTFLQQLADPQ